MYQYLLIGYAIFLYFLLKWIHRLLEECKFVADPEREMKEAWKPFARFDYNNWNRLEIYFCAATLFPLRVLINVPLLSLAVIVLRVLAIGKTFQVNSHLGSQIDEPWHPVKLKIAKVFLVFVARTLLFVDGFYSLPTTLKKYSDYDASAQTVHSVPSIMVSNHVSFWDTIIYVYKFMPAYLSKEEVKHYPLIGPITTGLKTIYLNRESEIERKQITEKMRKRVEAIEQGANYTPLIIFPEGTTTNSKYIISFKRGAFDPLKPVKICCLKYYDRHFNLSNDELDILNVIVLSLCQFYNKVEIIEFEGLYFPKMDEQPDKVALFFFISLFPQALYFQEKVRDIISQALQVPKIDSGFRNYLDLMQNQKKEKQKKA